MCIRKLGLVGLFVLTLCCALPAQTYCSIKNLRGTWGFSELGWTVPLASSDGGASPVTVLGAMVVESSGKIRGSGTTISGAGIPGTPIPAGTVLDFDFEGTIEINSDCAGILRYSIHLKGTPSALPGQFIERIVYSPWKDEILSMSIQSPLSKPMWIGTYKRVDLFPSAFNWPAIIQ